MNRCCNKFLIKNLNALHNLKVGIKNYRVLSTIIQYSQFEKQKIHSYANEISNYTQNRNLARDTPKKQNKNLPQKIKKNETTKKKTSSNQEKKQTTEDIFKPLEVKPLTSVDENIGLELGGKLEKCNY